MGARLVVASFLSALASGAFAAAQEPAEPSMRLVGRVVDALGEPVPAAEVWVTRNRLPLAQVRTEGSGAFLFPNLPSGTFEVHARGAGRTHRSATASLSAHEPVRFVELQLFDAALLRGRVRGAGGAPLRGAIVGVRPTMPGFGDVEYAVTGDDGGYALREAPLGDVELFAAAGAHAVYRETLRLAGDLERDLDLAPGAAVAVRVHVEGAPEALLRRTTCSVVLAHGGTPLPLPPWRTSGRPDARGDFVLTDLPSDVQYREAMLRAPGAEFGAQYPVTTDPRGVLVAPFRCVPGPHELRGRLVDRAGKGIAGSSVRVRTDGEDLVVPTGDGGTFAVIAPMGTGDRFRLLPGEPRHARSWATVRNEADWRGRGAETFAPERRYALAVVEGVVVTGRLLDAGGVPAAGRVVRLEGSFPMGPQTSFRTVDEAVTGIDGRYRFVVDEAADVPLRVAAAAPGVAVSDEFALELRGETTVPDLRAAAGGRIEGTLRTAAGEPLAGTVVVLRPMQQGESATLQTKTTRDGRFAFAGVPPGTRVLGWATRTAITVPVDVEPVEVTRGATVRRELVVR